MMCPPTFWVPRLHVPPAPHRAVATQQGAWWRRAQGKSVKVHRTAPGSTAARQPVLGSLQPEVTVGVRFSGTTRLQDSRVAVPGTD